MAEEPKIAPARTFLRSFRILLKTARMYGAEHQRTAAQLEIAWSELRSALRVLDETGLVIGVSDPRLLLNGTLLEANAPDRSFAELLAANGVASIRFSSLIRPEDFTRFVQLFTAGAGKGVGLADELKLAFGDSPTAAIRINEIHYLPGSTAGFVGVTTPAMADSVSAGAAQLARWLIDPTELLQFLASSEGSQTPSAAAGQEQGRSQGRARMEPVSSESAPVTSSSSLKEEDLLSVLHLLVKLAEANLKTPSSAEVFHLKRELASLQAGARATLQRNIENLAATPPSARSDIPLLVQLAERLAIHFAIESFEGGNIRIAMVHQLLHRLGREIDALRKIVGSHKPESRDAGLPVEPLAEILDRQFWAALTEKSKSSALLSPEAWCIPPHQVRDFVQQLLTQGEVSTAADVLRNFVGCLQSSDPDARRKCAAALPELAHLYALPELRLLAATLNILEEQLDQVEPGELQDLLTGAFVSLSEHVVTHSGYSGFRQLMASAEKLERRVPGLSATLKAQAGFEQRLPNLIEETVRAPQVADDLLEVLRLTPEAALGQLLARFARCRRRRERERLVGLARELGPASIAYLTETLRSRSAAEGALTVGLLVRLDVAAVESILPGRLPEWNIGYHEMVVWQLAASGAPERGRLLAQFLARLHPLVQPMAVDEMGMSRDLATADLLIRVGAGQLSEVSSPYLRVKAIEALGRLGAVDAVPMLRPLVEAKRNWRWLHPRELRIVAAQALSKIDLDWAQNGLPACDLNAEEFALAPLDPSEDAPGVRQRRYPRIRFPRLLAASLLTASSRHSLEISSMSLGGGLFPGNTSLSSGSAATLVLQSGWRALSAQVLLLSTYPTGVAFEIANIELDDRLKLRDLLAKVRSHAG